MLCVYINLTFRLHLASPPSPSGGGAWALNEASLHHAWHTGCSVLTALWCGCSVVKLSSPDPILALASMDTHLSSPHHRDHSWHNGTNNARTLPYHGHASVREYPFSTISKVLSILKWQIITTLNRKLLEKQRVENHFASYEVHIDHFFYNVKATVSFGIF